MEKLRELRTQLNLNYGEFAEKLNISKTYYWQIENNKRGLSYGMAIRIAKAFNLKPDDIFYEELKNKEVL